MKAISKPYFLFCIALSNESAAASTVSLKAARINDTWMELSSAVSILPGDFIECDAFISDWSEDMEVLNTYQLTIDSSTLVSGNSGVLRPYFYDGPMPLFNPCASDNDCIEYAYCGNIFCAPPPCPLEGCPLDQLCTLAREWCFQYKEHPWQGSREVGVLIDVTRPDFVFFGLSPLALVIITRAPAHSWGSISLVVEGIPAPGFPLYAGSVIYRASAAESPDGEACGVFSIGFLEHIETTFFCAPPADPDIPCFAVIPDIIPLHVNVDCSGMTPPRSDCNRDSFVTMAEHRHLAECFDGTALEGTCFCLDNNDDGQVDLRDFADLQNLFDGP